MVQGERFTLFNQLVSPSGVAKRSFKTVTESKAEMSDASDARLVLRYTMRVQPPRISAVRSFDRRSLQDDIRYRCDDHCCSEFLIKSADARHRNGCRLSFETASESPS